MDTAPVTHVPEPWAEADGPHAAEAAAITTCATAACYGYREAPYGPFRIHSRRTTGGARQGRGARTSAADSLIGWPIERPLRFGPAEALALAIETARVRRVPVDKNWRAASVIGGRRRPATTARTVFRTLVLP